MVALPPISPRCDSWHLVRPRPGQMLSIRLVPSGGNAGRIIGLVAVAILIVVAVVFQQYWAVGLLVSAGMMLAQPWMTPAPPEIARNQAETPSYAITGQRNTGAELEQGAVPARPLQADAALRGAAVPRDRRRRDLLADAVRLLARADRHRGDVHRRDRARQLPRGRVAVPPRLLVDAGQGRLEPAARFPANPAFGDTWTCTAPVRPTAPATPPARRSPSTASPTRAAPPPGISTRASRSACFPTTSTRTPLNVAVKYGAPQIRTSQQNGDELAIELVFERGIVHIENQPAGKKKDTSVGAADRAVAGRRERLGDGARARPSRGRQSTPLYWGRAWKPGDFSTPNADQDLGRPHHPAERQLRRGAQLRQLLVDRAAHADLRRSGAGAGGGACWRCASAPPSSCRACSTRSTSSPGPSPATGTRRPATGSGGRPRQPAALFRHVLQHPAREKPATDAQIDLARLQYWDGVTRPAGREFNGVIEAKGSLYDVLIKIGRIGRAMPTLRDLQVLGDDRRAEDRAGADVHAAQPLELRRRDDARADAARLPHRLRRPGAGLAHRRGAWSTTTATTPPTPCASTGSNGRASTDRDQAWKEGRYHLAQQRLRREVHRINVDFEQLACERGDLVALQHDVIAVGLASARIVARTEVGDRRHRRHPRRRR